VIKIGGQGSTRRPPRKGPRRKLHDIPPLYYTPDSSRYYWPVSCLLDGFPDGGDTLHLLESLPRREMCRHPPPLVDSPPRGRHRLVYATPRLDLFARFVLQRILTHCRVCMEKSPTHFHAHKRCSDHCVGAAVGPCA